ncbi:MAG: CCA tRNA nucleotidyltransferase [bacterium]
MKPPDLSENLDHEIYRNIILAADESKSLVYLVGGWVRNLILHRPILDIDLLVYGPDYFLSSLHKRIPSTLICLDKIRGIYRFALKKSGVTIDVTLRKKIEPLFQNLLERDFTINAMAIKGADILKPNISITDILIDPFNGRHDAQKGIIRMISKENFLNDPLRLCRAFRFSSEFGFIINKKTLDFISENICLIKKVAPERIHEEWIKIMNSSQAAIYIRKMKETGLLGQIFPEIIPMDGLDQGSKHKSTLWEHSWTTLFYLEEILNTPGKHLNPRLNEMVSYVKKKYKNQIHCLKMAAIFHDIGKPKVKDIGKKGQVIFYGHQQTGGIVLKSRMEALRFSKAEIHLTIKLVQDHMRPLMLSLAKKVSDKARVNLFIHLGETWQALLLLSIADIFSTWTNREMIEKYLDFLNSLFLFREKMEKQYRKGPLITGEDLKQKLLFPPGPIMGRALRSINQLFLCDKIKTKAEAFEIAKNFLHLAEKEKTEKDSA